MHATTTSTLDIDDAEHIVDTALMMANADKIAVWGYLMTQYNLKAGLMKFGDKAAHAAIMELTQLHVMDMWAVMDPSKLMQEDRSKASSLLLLLKEEHCSKLKGRACINRALQRAYIPHRVDIHHSGNRSK